MHFWCLTFVILLYILKRVLKELILTLLILISNPNRQRIKYQIGKKMFSINMKLFFEKKKTKGHVRVCNTDVLKYTPIKYIIEVNAH